MENFAYGEINERSFSNPYRWSSLGTLNLVFHVSSDDRGSRPEDISISVGVLSLVITLHNHRKPRVIAIPTLS